jgi:hypothetical protein
LLRNKPDFIWAFNSPTLSCTTSIGKFNEKLNKPSCFGRTKTFCGGIIVIPPGNIKISKEEVPNSDGVTWRVDYCITKETKDDIWMLNTVVDMVDVLG